MAAAPATLRRELVRAAVVFGLALPTLAAEHAFELTLAKGRAAKPPQWQVAKDDTVVVRIASDEPGEAHLHGYRLSAKVEPGKGAEWRFRAHATGRYRLEWHGAADKATHHHGPPLATLDVLPR